MKRTLILTTALCLVAGAAHAGGSHEQPHGQVTAPTYTATATNVVKPTATAGAQSRSTSGAVSTSGATGGPSNASTGPVTVNNTTGGGSGGGYSYSARGNTPDAIAPSIAGGNVCSVGGSAALSLAGIGLGGGVMSEGGNCVLRQNAALLFNMGMRDEAIKMLCQDTHFSTVFAQVGKPCPADIARWQAAGYHQDPRGGWSR